MSLLKKTYFNSSLNEDALKKRMSDAALGNEKFNNCKFRSKEQIKKNVKRCACQGGNYDLFGYQCTKRDIFNIDQSTCLYCNLFEKNE